MEYRPSVLTIRIKRLRPDAALPAYAYGSGEDAGLDLRAVEAVILQAGSAASVSTGIAIEIPPGYEGQIRPRSGMCLKHSILANFGTIDPGYRGEIRVVMLNFGRADYAIQTGDRIAQLVVSRYETVTFKESDLSDSDRGDRGFGSSGQ